MNIKMKDALKMLEENNGTTYVPVHLPSLNKSVSFKPLTVGKIKSIAKLFIENDNISDIGIILTSMLLDLCVEDLDLETICEIDRLRILLELRKSNSLSENVFNIKCSNEDCDYEINYNVNIEELLTKFTDVPESTIKDFPHNDVKFTIEFGLPSVNLVLKYKQFIENTKNVLLKGEEKFTDADLMKIEFYLVKYSSLLYIRNIQINDSYIDGFVESSITERNKLIDSLPPEVLVYIKQDIIKSKKYDIPDIIKESSSCQKCGTGKISINLDIDDFFLI